MRRDDVYSDHFDISCFTFLSLDVALYSSCVLFDLLFCRGIVDDHNAQKENWEILTQYKETRVVVEKLLLTLW